MDAITELAASARARNAARREAQNAALAAPLQERIAELEAQNAALRAELAAKGAKSTGKRGR